RCRVSRATVTQSLHVVAKSLVVNFFKKNTRDELLSKSIYYPILIGLYNHQKVASDGYKNMERRVIFLRFLSLHFNMKDLGDASYLGIGKFILSRLLHVLKRREKSKIKQFNLSI
ncbi:hypothetical protein ACJX0J_020982, partial [Zea mays]